jgi:hypothetical protein
MTVSWKTEDILSACRQCLADNPDANRHFRALAPSYQRQYILWIGTAKQAKTRRRRTEASEKLQRGEKPGLEQNPSLPKELYPNRTKLRSKKNFSLYIFFGAISFLIISIIYCIFIFGSSKIGLPGYQSESGNPLGRFFLLTLKMP